MGIWPCLLIRKEIGLRCIRYRNREKAKEAKKAKEAISLQTQDVRFADPRLMT